jgi:CheY-like chemotaxis protein
MTRHCEAKGHQLYLPKSDPRPALGVALTEASGPAPLGDAAHTIAPAAHGKPSILIADDNDDVVESLAMLLEIHGYEVLKAYDGLQAVAVAEHGHPEAVLLDLSMPRLDGHAACRRIRALPEGKHLRIIALTGWDPDGDESSSRDAGFDGHLVKPISTSTLLGLLAGA